MSRSSALPELVPEDVAKAAHYKLEQDAEIADPLELANYDAIIFGVSTRYGMMSAQMKNFLDQTGPLWAEGKLINKVASVMSSSATQHGGAELAILTTQASLQHHGMIIVPLSYAYQGQSGNDVVRGGSPYGMTTTSNTDGSRMPSEQELEGAEFQGKRVAEIAAKLSPDQPDKFQAHCRPHGVRPVVSDSGALVVFYPNSGGKPCLPVDRRLPTSSRADVAKLVDARDLKSLGREAVRVRAPSSAPFFHDQLSLIVEVCRAESERGVWAFPWSTGPATGPAEGSLQRTAGPVFPVFSGSGGSPASWRLR
jgi:NAD(P)H dehydrogenase (quinone)